MNRYALKIEYMGTPFHGWQKQPGLETVQGAINVALKNLDPFSDGVTGAGRTDAGVHATGQVAHVDLEKTWDANKLQQALNFYLKPKFAEIPRTTNSFLLELMNLLPPILGHVV